MMAYTVTWTPDAEDQLADIWLQANNRASVTVAQARIDSELRLAPFDKGIELSEGLRRITVSPLKVFYEILDTDRLVRVTAVVHVS
ncbi:MAG: type II toxin-antitoxin system RelE/ParE family toxin [Gemmataceae bacterium]